MQATDRITLVLRAKEGETLEQVLPFVQLGAPVSIGRGLAVINGASDEDLQMMLGKERDERAMDIERLESALEIDKHLALAAPEMANLLKRIDVKVGGLMAVAGHGMAPSEEMWDEAESVLAEIELLLNLSQGKPYAPSNLLDEAPLEKFNDFEKKDSSPALSLMNPDSMHIDDRVRMVANAKRYEWLRDVAFNTPRQDLVPRDKSGNMLIDQDLDAEIDCAMKTYPGEQEAEPCAD